MKDTQGVTVYNLPGKPNLRFMSWSKLLFIFNHFQDVVKELHFGIYIGLDVVQGK